MANRNNQHIYSPSFIEMAYRKLKNLTAQQKENLSTDELKHFRDDQSLQKFCKEERIDHVGMLLSRVGMDWTWRFHEDSYDADMLEFNAVDQNLYPHKQLDVTEATARHNVCIISSRDVMVLSHMVAQNCTSKVYAISDFTRGLQVKAGQLKTLGSWERDIAGAKDAHELFNDLLLEQLNSFAYAEEILGLDEGDLRILCALYKKHTSALRMTEIAELTKAKGKKMYFRKNMQKLLDEGLVSSDTKDTKKVWANSTYFLITTAGLNKIISYQKFIHKNVFNL